MATKYFMNGGVNNNWSADTNWSTTSSAGPNNTTHAVSGDAAILDSGSPNCTIDTNSACDTLTCTGYAATLTINNRLTVGGDVTLGGTIAGTAQLWITAAANMTSNGKTLTGGLVLQNAVTRTLQDDWTVNGSFAPYGTLNNNGTTKTITCVGGLSGADGLVGSANLKLTGGTWSGNNWIDNNLEFAGNVTVSGSVRYKNGTMTYTSGTITTTGSTVQIGGSTTTLNTNGITWNTLALTINATTTLTLSSLLSATTIQNSTAMTFGGTAGFTAGTFTNNGAIGGNITVTLTQGLTYTVSTTLSIAGNGANHYTLASSSGSLKVAFVFSGGTSPSLTLVKATRLDSSGGTAIYTDDTITSCLNWSAPPSGGTVSAVYNVTP